MTEVETFIERILEADRAGLKTRDIAILYHVIQTPGLCGLDITRRLSCVNRSSAQSHFPRLIRLGFVEDRREREASAVPSRFYITAKGLELWRKIAPLGGYDL